jgi:type II secretory pathway pseudopilin PulG
MVVVMAIIAIISTIGISAFINTRDQALVSDAAEKFLSSTREAQNRSISITKGKGTKGRPNTDTVIWGIRKHSGANTFSLIYLDINDHAATSALVYDQETPIDKGLVTISSSYINGLSGAQTVDNGDRYIFYSSPFAKASTADEPCTSGVIGRCFWKQSSNQALDWELNTGANGFTNPKDYIRVLFSHKGHTQSVVINSRGDSYLE